MRTPKPSINFTSSFLHTHYICIHTFAVWYDEHTSPKIADLAYRKRSRTGFTEKFGKADVCFMLMAAGIRAVLAEHQEIEMRR